jgi:hypothetical protein
MVIYTLCIFLLFTVLATLIINFHGSSHYIQAHIISKPESVFIDNPYDVQFIITLLASFTIVKVRFGKS